MRCIEGKVDEEKRTGEKGTRKEREMKGRKRKVTQREGKAKGKRKCK